METTRIADLGTVITGKTPASKNPEHFGNDYPFITPTDIGLGRIVHTERRISEEGQVIFRRQILPRHSVCFVCIGATIGKICMTTERSLTNQQINSIVVDTKRHDPFFVYYLLSTYMDEVKNIAGGAATPIVNKTSFENIEVIVPPLPTQRKIVGILSAYDDLIESNLRRIKILEEMAQNLYREWFVKFRFPGHQHARFTDSPLGRIPEGWKVQRLSDVVSDIIDYRGKTPKKLGGEWSNSGILALSAKNIKGGELINLDKSKRISAQLYSKWMKSELQSHDILMTSEAPLGELYYLLDGKNYCLSQRLFAIRAKIEVIVPSVLYYGLSTPEIQAQIHRRATGTTVRGIRQALLREVPIVVPPRSLQQVVGDKLDSLIGLKANLSRKNISLRRSRDLLLPRLISDELDVSELDIVVPEEGLA